MDGAGNLFVVDSGNNRVQRFGTPAPEVVVALFHGFAPRLIPKHERRFTGFDDKILALDARGMTVREIQGFLAEMYHMEVAPDLISTVTDGTSPR